MSRKLVLKIPGDAEEFVVDKFNEYVRKAGIYKLVFYACRGVLATAAILIPFVSTYPILLNIASFAILACVIIERTFDPLEKWRLSSMATDEIALQFLKRSGDYEEFSEAVLGIMNREKDEFRIYRDIKKLLESYRL